MRAFKKKSTGEWLGRLDNRQPNPQPSAHIAEVAAEYGLPESDVELVESPTDPRVNPLMPPVRADTPEEAEKKRLKALANKPVLTPQERDDLLQNLAKRFLV